MSDAAAVSRRGRHALRAGAALTLAACFAGLPARTTRAEGDAKAPKAAPSWPNAEKTTPEELATLLKTPGAPKPVLFNVGFRTLFAQAHIPGSSFFGPGLDAAAVEALRKAVSGLAKTTPIVLYCGCCPWQRCPNLEKPWTMLAAAGFTHVKVLYIPKNFGVDWVQKGFPAESDAGHD